VTNGRLARAFWIGAAGILVLAALIGIAALLRSDFTETDGQIVLTLLTLLVASGTAVAGLTLVERGRLAPLGWGAAVLAVFCFALITATIWEGFDSETLGKLGLTAALALVTALLGTTQLVLHRGRLVLLVAGTWLVLALALVLTVGGVWSEADDAGLWKAAGTFWILGLLGWLLLPVLQRFSSAGFAPGAARVLGVLDGVELVATRDSVEGVAVELPARGERLVLRRRV
jgi:hypothetical protein